MADLVRTHVSAIGPTPALREAASAASVSEQVEFIDADTAARRHWDIVLTTSPDGVSEPWRRHAERVVFANFSERSG